MTAIIIILSVLLFIFIYLWWLEKSKRKGYEDIVEQDQVYINKLVERMGQYRDAVKNLENKSSKN